MPGGVGRALGGGHRRKILGIIFPILAFVAMGFDDAIANMFFLPAAIFAGIDITWAESRWNFIWSFLGNLVGAAVFVGGAYGSCTAGTSQRATRAAATGAGRSERGTATGTGVRGLRSRAPPEPEGRGGRRDAGLAPGSDSHVS